MTASTTRIQGNIDVRVDLDDAVGYVIDFLRRPRGGSYATYGYDIYIDTVLISFFEEKYKLLFHSSSNARAALSPIFIDACWELCRRGILRPFTHDVRGQGSTQGAGFSVTAFGRQWLSERTFDSSVPTEPDRFAQMLSPYEPIFGEGFRERAQEAVRCYNAHAYLACCAMAGAAAETILLKISDKLNLVRVKNESITKTRNAIISNSQSGVKTDLLAYSEIIKYWRDEGMHHESWETRPEKAYIALAMLLCLARFAKDKWFDDDD